MARISRMMGESFSCGEVLIRRVLAAAEHVEVAQRDRGQTVQPVELHGVRLGRQLLQRVGRDRTRRHRLDLRQRLALPVDRGGRRHHEAPHAGVPRRQQHVQRAQTRLDGLKDITWALLNSNEFLYVD